MFRAKVGNEVGSRRPRTIVEVDWHVLRRNDPEWDADFCLYAYVHPDTDRILYIGKADHQTVWSRMHGRHKDKLFDNLYERFGIEPVDLKVIQGELIMEEGSRRSSLLLSDVESLLIIRLQPPGNTASTRSRSSRPGLRVECAGDWPHRRKNFHDR